MVPFESYHYVISLSINDLLFLNSILMRTEKKERENESNATKMMGRGLISGNSANGKIFVHHSFFCR